MATPNTYEESLRAHRQAIYDWLGGLHVDYPADSEEPEDQRHNWPILRVFASPDRVFAAVADLLVNTGWFKTKPSDDERRNMAKNVDILPLPVCSIQMDEPQQDSSFGGVLKRPLRTLNTQTGLFERHPWPGHYRTNFTVTFWCRKGYTADHIREWVYAQFGNPGANNNETFIPVNHKAPWGTMLQALRLDGGSDQSQLEGQDVRYMRFSYTFNLRTWIMRVTTNEPARVQTVVVDADGVQVDTGDTLADISETVVPVGRFESDNLFHYCFPENKIPLLWPHTGNAVVQLASASSLARPSRPDAIRVDLSSISDSMDFGEWLTDRVSGYAMFSVWFDYKSSATVTFEAGERALTDDARTSVLAVGLPASRDWCPVHQFVLFAKALGSFSIAGAGVQSRVLLSRIHVTRLIDSVPTTPTTVNSTSAVWDGLPSEPFLIGVRFSTIGAGDVLTVSDDAVSPTYSRQFHLDSSTATRVISLIQPAQASLKLSWPSTTSIAVAWVQRYHLGYHGNAV